MMKMIDGLNETLAKEYNLTSIASDMTAGYSGTDKNTYKKILAEYTAGKIAEYIGTNNSKPTYKQVQDMMRYGMTAQKTGFLGDKVPAPVVLYMQTGVEDYKRNMRNDVPDGYNVRYKGSWYHISDRQILAIRDGQMTLDEAIREGYK